MRALLLALLLMLPLPARAEPLTAAIDQVLDGLDTAALEEALSPDDPLQATGGLRATLSALARGEITLSFDEAMELLAARFASAARGSVWRLTRLAAPTLVWSILRRLTGKDSSAGKTVCYLMVCVCLARDLADHLALCTASMENKFLIDKSCQRGIHCEMVLRLAHRMHMQTHIDVLQHTVSQHLDLSRRILNLAFCDQLLSKCHVRIFLCRGKEQTDSSAIGYRSAVF